jgi:hypothetical protein
MSVTEAYCHRISTIVSHIGVGLCVSEYRDYKNEISLFIFRLKKAENTV